VPSSPASTYVVHLSSAYTGGTGSSSSLSTDFQWVAAWLSGNALVLINVVALRRSQYWDGWPFVGVPTWYLTKATYSHLLSLVSGHPAVARHNEYWRRSRNSMFCVTLGSVSLCHCVTVTVNVTEKMYIITITVIIIVIVITIINITNQWISGRHGSRWWHHAEWSHVTCGWWRHVLTCNQSMTSPR